MRCGCVEFRDSVVAWYGGRWAVVGSGVCCRERWVVWLSICTNHHHIIHHPCYVPSSVVEGHSRRSIVCQYHHACLACPHILVSSLSASCSHSPSVCCCCSGFVWGRGGISQDAAQYSSCTPAYEHHLSPAIIRIVTRHQLVLPAIMTLEAVVCNRPIVGRFWHV